jgi:bacteriorhodopsin
MADIDVVPKRRTNTWLWIVLAIVVLAILIWAFAGRTHTVTELRHGYPATVATLMSSNHPLLI